MEERYADLHVHTCYSDSTFSPEEIVEKASREGLSAIAITDHDCVQGIPLCMELGKDYGLEIIPGVELTVEKDGHEIHILGYYINWQDKQLKDKIEVIQKSRVERIYKMVDLLRSKGITVDPKEVFKLSGQGSVGRLHLAYAMVKAKQVRTLHDAFKTYLGYLKSCYVNHIKFSPQEAIEMILNSGGVPILAHPHVMENDEFIHKFIKYGLRGIEVYHTDHKGATEKKYLKIAKKHNLLVTGGSDCHGLRNGGVRVGTVKVSYSMVEGLKEEAHRIQVGNRDRNAY